MRFAPRPRGLGSTVVGSPTVSALRAAGAGLIPPAEHSMVNAGCKARLDSNDPQWATPQPERPGSGSKVGQNVK